MADNEANKSEHDGTELAILWLDQYKLFLVSGFLVLFLIYVFWVGLLPVMLTGKIESVRFVAPYIKGPFFINSILSFIFIPLLLFSALWRSGTIFFYPDKIVFHRVIGGTRSLEYSSMLVRQKAFNIFICNYDDLQGANWFQSVWIEWLYGMYAPQGKLLINKGDGQNAIDILVKNARCYQDMKDKI